MVNKITTPPTSNDVIGKINELVDDKQDAITSSNKLSASLVSGLATVATSGSYNDLNNKPTIPTVNNATLTIQKNGTNVATFTANASNNVTANISVPTVTSTYTATGTDAVNGVAVSNAIATKQDNLVSGTNIKTINGNSLLGSGNIEIESGGTVTVDGDLSQTSENPVQNKVITAAISDLYSQVNIDTYLDLIIAGNTQDLPIITQGTYETDLTNIIGGTYVNV